MSGRDFVILMLGIGLASILHNRQDAVGGGGPMSAEVEERHRRMLRPLIAMLLLAYAAFLAGLDLYVVYRLIVWRDPWETGLYFMLPGLLAASVLLAWIGLVLFDKNLPKRLGRACRAVIEAFRSPAPNASKPKPAGFGHDLD